MIDDEETVIRDIRDGLDTVPEMLDAHVPPGDMTIRRMYGARIRATIRRSDRIREAGTKVSPCYGRPLKRYEVVEEGSE